MTDARSNRRPRFFPRRWGVAPAVYVACRDLSDRHHQADHGQLTCELPIAQTWYQLGIKTSPSG
jgi:hypothetical protein